MFCNKHGGGPAAKVAREARQQWRKMRGWLYEQGYDDDLCGAVTYPARVVLAEAWKAAREHGDPRIYQQARRQVAARYRKRIEVMGRSDILADLGL